jgi:hypothetical protein
VAASLAACSSFPGLWGWLLVFPAEMFLVVGWLGQHRFPAAAALSVSATAAAAASLPRLRWGAPPPPSALLNLLALLAVSLAVCRTANRARRAAWRRECLYEAELRGLRAALLDLLPPHAVPRLADIAAVQLPPRRLRASVIFTVMYAKLQMQKPVRVLVNPIQSRMRLFWQIHHRLSPDSSAACGQAPNRRLTKKSPVLGVTCSGKWHIRT